MTMKALYYDGKLSLKDVEAPRPRQDEALIRVSLAGICGTDLQILKGYSGFRGIPGHEFVGEVVECSSPAWIGKRVVGEINITCGHCEWCRRGIGRHCAARSVMGIINHSGAFAEMAVLPVENLHAVPEGVSDRTAVFTEPVAAAAEILEQLPGAARSQVAVLGDGRLGLLVAQVLGNAGARITVIGRSPWKLQLARSWGLEVVCLPRPSASSAAVDGAAIVPNAAAFAPEAVLQPLPPRSFPVVVEATGSPEGLQEALRLVQPRGAVVMKSTFHALAQFDTAKLVVDEVTLLGSRCGNFQTALSLLSRGAVRVEPMISRIFPMRQAVEAFDYLENSSCLKVLLANSD